MFIKYSHSKKEEGMCAKYSGQKYEIARMLDMRKTEVIQMVIRGLGTVTK